MSNDLFQNSTNNYANPGFAPCVGSADTNFLQFVKNGIGITSGNEIISKIDFTSLKIPVSSWSNQTRVLAPGEVTFIQGLSKILLQKQMAFTMPTLVSTDEDLNKYFIEIDCSIHYYSGFSYYGTNIDSSSNYDTGVGIDDALTLSMYTKSISVTSTYSEDLLYFNSTTAGYDFTVSNVILTIIDASQNSDSPFAANIINGERIPITYDLSEDSDSFISFAKHPNSASQGIILKNVFPSSTTTSTYDKWLYLNHARDRVTLYESIDLTFLIDSSVDYIIIFDGSTLYDYFQDANYTDPNYLKDINIPDTSISIVKQDVSIYLDASISTNIDVSIYEFTDASIYDSSIGNSNIIDSYIVSDSSLYYITIDNSANTSLINLNLNNITFAYIKDASIANSVLISDSSLINVTLDNDYGVNNHYVSSTILGNTISGSYINYSALNNSIITDVSIINSIINDSSVYISYIQDSSISNTNIINNAGVILENVDASGGTISATSYSGGTLDGVYISDSSIVGANIIHDSSINGGLIENCWINAYKLEASVDASGNITYDYIINDSTLEIDTSAWAVNMSGVAIWDSSINNAIIYDSSIFNSYIQDSSLINCKVYNVDIDKNVTFVGTNTVLIDASISLLSNIQTDVSTYYRQVVKSLDIGLNGSSSNSVMSAGDYLQYVTDNNLWDKVGEVYMWTAAPDSGIYNEINLINGFYLYNPHTFAISAEYLVIS